MESLRESTLAFDVGGLILQGRNSSKDEFADMITKYYSMQGGDGSGCSA
jgi:hypothetical protein